MVVGTVLAALVTLFALTYNPTVHTPTPWQLASVSDDGRDLVLRVDPGCGDKLGPTEVIETVVAVQIVTHVSFGSRGGDDGCMPAVDSYTETVTLEQPLGRRILTGCDVSNEGEVRAVRCSEVRQE